jgi:peptidoglycan/xylan/chitin deacetylase (PgdA/CDA1 family)
MKRALGAVAGWRPRPQQRRVILLYHSVGDSPLAVGLAGFRQQMQWLSANAAVMPLRQLLSNASAVPLQAAITFDDGYSSLHSAALPILNDAGAVASAFLNTGWIETDRRRSSDAAQGHYPQEQFLLWREVEALAASGWDIGSHGIDHLDLTRQPDDVVNRELHLSRRQIEQAGLVCSPIFSYTWGRHNAHLRALVKAAGYTHALAGIHEPVAESGDPFAIPRINIDRHCTLDDFKAIVRGDWDYLGWLQHAKAAVSGFCAG